MRALLLGLPSIPPQILSTLRLSDTRCLTRFAVTTRTGEEMTLVLDLKLQTTLEPQYRSVQFVKRWFLRGMTGEAAIDQLPERPSPEHGPEAIARAQLHGLQIDDIAHVFQFASPTNQQATGPLSRFDSMLRNGPFEPLIGHAHAEIMQAVQMSPHKCFITVGITKHTTLETGLKYVYCWVVGLQQQQGVGGGLNGFENCWMTESVFPVTGGHLKPYPMDEI